MPALLQDVEFPGNVPDQECRSIPLKPEAGGDYAGPVREGLPCRDDTGSCTLSDRRRGLHPLYAVHHLPSPGWNAGQGVFGRTAQRRKGACSVLEKNEMLLDCLSRAINQIKTAGLVYADVQFSLHGRVQVRCFI